MRGQYAPEYPVITENRNSGLYPYKVPMTVQEIDQDGHIWFLLSSQSDTYQNLMSNPKVSLAFADASSYTFLSIDGIAELSEDSNKIDKYWSKFVEVFFEKGKQDTCIRVLRVIPKESHYWDSQSGKLMTLLKITGAALTDSQADIGRQGDIHI